jgi:hypothetical protein
MSKVIKWQYNDLFGSRRDKLINLLLTETIFLKGRRKYLSDTCNEEYLEIAFDKLDFLLNALMNYDHDLNDNDFNKIILIIYNILREIIEKIEK